MAITLDVFLAEVDNLLQTSDDELAQLARYRQILAAVEQYSKDAPDQITEDESGDGGRYYAIDGDGGLLASWVDGFSRVSQVEYPAATIADDELPQLLEPGDWQEYESGGVRYLLLPNHAPAATETMRITYTAPYTWSQSSVTSTENQAGNTFQVGDYVYEESGTWYEANEQRIATHIVTQTGDPNFTAAILQVDPPVQDFFAICYLAASFCATAIASKYSRTNDSTITADSINHTTRAGEFRQRAAEFAKLYRQHMGLGGGDDGAAKPGSGAFVDWDTSPGWPGGRSYLFHNRRTR